MVQPNIVEHMAYAKVYVVNKYFVCNYAFSNHMSSKSSKHMKKIEFYFIMYKLSQPLHQLGKCFFTHCAPFINMTMRIYIFLFMGWRCYVHMMCLIPMLIPPHPKQRNL